MIGIDIGTGSVRLCYNNIGNKQFLVKSSNITTTNNQNYITQSSKEIFKKILNLLNELPSDFTSISVAATCSMVVLEKIEVNEKVYLKSFSCDFNQNEHNNDILLWMDNRSISQSKKLNEKLSARVLDKLGGKIIPELGLPKLKWLADNYPDKKLVTFELHDWFSYLLLVGGFNDDGLVTYVRSNNEFGYGSQALDGSVKGWSTDFLETLDIFIEIGKSEINLAKFGKLYAIGQPLGRLHQSIIQNDAIVCNGCIDCYAGWLSTLRDGYSYDSNSLSMIAGTSTCFLLSTTSNIEPIPGIWGPFNQLLNLKANLFEFGQPATGKLFECLFQQFDKVIRDKFNIDNIFDNIGDIFEKLELATQQLENSYRKSIHHIIKHYFYYGDVFGNRSPYNDFRMGEMLIDGANSNPDLSSIIHSQDLISLVIKYNLILEFLCFQVKQILSIIQQNNGPSINSIIIAGSQANNERFTSLLGKILQVKIVKIDGLDSKYNVVKGSSIISLIGYKLTTTNNSYEHALTQSIHENSYPNNAAQHEYSLTLPTEPDRVLDVKYKIYLDMCESQVRYRQMIEDISQM